MWSATCQDDLLLIHSRFQDGREAAGRNMNHRHNREEYSEVSFYIL